MSASLRQLAACIGIQGSFSILGDFFFRRVMPPDPTGASTQVSLLRQAGLLKGPHFHLNVIAVGVDLFTDAEDQQIDYFIFKIRNISSLVGARHRMRFPADNRSAKDRQALAYRSRTPFGPQSRQLIGPVVGPERSSVAVDVTQTRRIMLLPNKVLR
jgi:hypothetical protein